MSVVDNTIESLSLSLSNSQVVEEGEDGWPQLCQVLSLPGERDGRVARYPAKTAALLPASLTA